MEESLARKIIDEVIDHAPWCRIWFCYFGEPLLKRRNGLFERIRYAKERGLARAVINTNGNLMDEQTVRDMMWAGLDEVYVGIDAATAHVYDRVRRGGRFEEVVKNVHRLVELSQGQIQVTVQFGVYENNEHELDEFQAYWSQFPVNIFIRPKLTWIGFLEDRVRLDTERYPCPWIFDSININEDGRVPYCVCDWVNRHPQGDTNQESIVTIWREKIRHYLILHARRSWDGLPDFCQSCRDWQTKEPPDPALMEWMSDLDL